MARTGRPPKPVEEHKRTGTYRPVRHETKGALALVDPTPRPDALVRAPIDVFVDILQQGVHWLAVTDTIKLTLLRQMLEERGELYAAVQSGVGDRKALRDLDKQIMSALSDLGFDPAARSRLGLAEVKAQSKLEELRARRDKRASSVVDADDGG